MKRTGFAERHGISGEVAESIRLETGEFHDFTPFLCVFGNELSKLGGRAPNTVPPSERPHLVIGPIVASGVGGVRGRRGKFRMASHIQIPNHAIYRII